MTGFTVLSMKSDSDFNDSLRVMAAGFFRTGGQFERTAWVLEPLQSNKVLQPLTAGLLFHSLLGQKKWSEAFWIYRSQASIDFQDVLRFLEMEKKNREFDRKEKLAMLDFFFPQLVDYEKNNRWPSSSQTLDTHHVETYPLSFESSMIIPFLDGFLGFVRAPITWLLVLFNIFSFFQSYELSRGRQSELSHWYGDQNFLHTQGRVYKQYGGHGTLARAKNMEILGRLAFQDQTFLDVALKKPWVGDQVAIASWKKSLSEFLSLKVSYPPTFLGMSDSRKDFFFHY